MFFDEADNLYCEGFCRKDNYFPLKRGHNSLFYSNLKLDNDEVVDLMELMVGIDEVEIDDSLLGLEYRKKDFVNFKKNRPLVDMQ
jgi:hypothetical protein